VSAGEIYYLNIQNWSSTQGGYVLDFGNSTASIFDVNPPLIDNFTAPTCGDNTFYIHFNENVLCSSVAISNFTLTGPGGPYTISDVSGAACNVGGETERDYYFTFSPAISTAGDYTVNYIGAAEDLCGNMAFSDSFSFTIIPGVSINLTSAQQTINQSVCLGNTITNITYSSSGASNHSFSGLPPGVSGDFNAATGNITISGTPSSTGVFTYSVSLSGSCGSVMEQGTITVAEDIVPIFQDFGPYCHGESPDILPSVSDNGVVGSWSPATINTNITGTFNYTFTPNTGQCSGNYIATIVVNNGVIPVFVSFGPYCLGDTPDLLPLTSNNGVQGTWMPPSINTNQLGLTEYVFTPNSGDCTAPQSVFVDIKANPIVSVTVSRPLNCDGENALISVSASGGSSPYNGIGDFVLNSGSHEFFVSDAFGCSDTESINLIAPEGMIASITDLSDIQCAGDNTGIIEVAISQGTPDYTVYWNGLSASSSNDVMRIENLRAGSYNVTVSDANRCTYTNIINIGEPIPMTVQSVASGPTCIGNSDGFIEIIVNGGTSPYLYWWMGLSQESSLFEGLSEGDYYFTISDANNCLYENHKTILRDNPVDCLTIPDAITPNGDGVNDTWVIGNINLYPFAEISIYNRWGQQLFFTNDISVVWDGIYNGKKLPVGAYLFVINTNTDAGRFSGVVSIVY
jgi:gliding motility-associated-like protein